MTKVLAINGFVVEGGFARVVECEGRKFGLLDNPDCDFGDMQASASAVEIGAEAYTYDGKRYVDTVIVHWNIADGYMPVADGDYHDACDWDNADEIVATCDDVEVTCYSGPVVQFAGRQYVVTGDAIHNYQDREYVSAGVDMNGEEVFMVWWSQVDPEDDENAHYAWSDKEGSTYAIDKDIIVCGEYELAEVVYK